MERLELKARRILYKDPDLLAVDKPSGIVSHGTVDPGRDHLLAAAQRWARADQGERAHLTMLHRLDRGTSGVVLFSRNPTFDATLGQAFSQRTVQKVYLAVVGLAPGKSLSDNPQTVATYLSAGRGPRGRTLVVRSGGKPAQTVVRPLLTYGDRMLVEARPKTGRAHQIRVHLAHLGFPILGDELYGGTRADVKRLLLHALSLQFEHPRTGEGVRIVAPPPRGFRARFPNLAQRDWASPEGQSEAQ